ncbi:PAS domain-containing protein [Paenibacillus sp. P26]|nr:PAS domain-containing protein [Paenibacillus sp. P26]
MMPTIILNSHERCRQTGLTSTSIPNPLTRLSEREMIRKQTKYHEVLSVVQFFGKKILNLLSDSPLMMLVADNEGHIISIFGDQPIRETLEKLGITEGIQLSEQEMGTNVVHLALSHKQPMQVVGQEHYHEYLHQSACYCVPFQLRFMNNLSGAIALMTAAEYHNPYNLPLLTSMVDSMERELLLRKQSRQQAIINELMINTVNNGVIITDPKGNIIEFNQFAEKITNRSREQVIGNTIFAFEQFGNLLYDVLKFKKRFTDVELIFTNSLEERTICLFDAMPIYNDQQILIGAYCQFRDITERSELEKQIFNAEKYSAVGKLAAGIAHEIRNPLTSVIGFIQLLRTRKQGDPDYEYIDLIYAELETMKRLITEFVLMAKPGSPERRLCDIEALIKDTVHFMESQAHLRNCVIHYDAPNENIHLNVDPSQLKQVFINLIQNAMEAMPAGGKVTISTKIDHLRKELVISVSDEGIGIASDQERDVLTPFFTTKEEGLGLGLSTCVRIVENHKGKITFTSEIGGGTTFFIQSPL